MFTQYTVLTVMKPRSSGNGGLASHIGRCYSADNVDKSRTHLNRIIVGTDNLLKDVDRRIQEVTPLLSRKIQKNAVKFQQIVLTGSPEQMKKIEMDDTLREFWIRDSVNWLNKQFGEENVVNVTLHRDETTMHLHCSVVPITTAPARENSRQNLENRKKQYKKTAGPRLSARDVFSKYSCEHMQTSYYEEVTKKYGFERGRSLKELKRQVVQRNANASESERLPLYSSKGIPIRDYYRWAARQTEIANEYRDAVYELQEEKENLSGDLQAIREEKQKGKKEVKLINDRIEDLQRHIKLLEQSVKAQTRQKENLEKELLEFRDGSEKERKELQDKLERKTAMLNAKTVELENAMRKYEAISKEIDESLDRIGKLSQLDFDLLETKNSIQAEIGELSIEREKQRGIREDLANEIKSLKAIADQNVYYVVYQHVMGFVRCSLFDVDEDEIRRVRKIAEELSQIQTQRDPILLLLQMLSAVCYYIGEAVGKSVFDMQLNLQKKIGVRVSLQKGEYSCIERFPELKPDADKIIMSLFFSKDKESAINKLRNGIINLTEEFDRHQNNLQEFCNDIFNIFEEERKPAMQILLKQAVEKYSKDKAEMERRQRLSINAGLHEAAQQQQQRNTEREDTETRSRSRFRR